MYFAFDATSMESLTRDLRDAAARCDREMNATLAEVGELLERTAREVVKSEKIKPTIHAHPPAGGVVVVTAGDADVPLAALWDKGNAGSGNSRKSTFSHPVFASGDRATWTWVQQIRKPFLKEARRVARPEINELMMKTWDEILEPIELGGK